MHQVELRKDLEEAVQQKVAGKFVFAMLSGGVDSLVITYLAKKYAKKLVAITAYDNEQSKDLTPAKACAKYLDLEHATAQLTALSAYELTDKVLTICECKTIVRLQCAIVAYACAYWAKDAGAEVLLCGDGSDALFGSTGHMRRKSKKPDFNEIKRDTYFRGEMFGVGADFKKICEHFKLEPCVPFRDSRLHKYIDVPDVQVNKPKEKQILRDAFRNEIPDELLNRERLTLQVGVGIKEQHIEYLREASNKGYKSPVFLVKERLNAIQSGESLQRLWRE